MQQFSARAFFWAGWVLESVKTDCLLLPTGYGGLGDEAVNSAAWDTPLDEETKAKAIKSLKNVEEACASIQLQITAETASELREALQGKERTYRFLMSRVGDLQKLIQKEMKGRFFLYIPPERARFWPKLNQPNIFGDDVADKFSSASFDIQHGAVCLATTVSTASVFHLMRVLEIGLTALGKVFSVSLARTNWEPAIREIESRVREMHKDPVWKALPDCKEQQEFYAQAASHFGILKDAWRNYTMHSRAKYTEDEAETIFNSVKSFMQKLAERLDDK